MKRRLRVRRRAEFQAAISGTRFYSGRSFVGFAVPSRGPDDRIGVTVSRAVKTSVDRNRARRRLREVTRRQLFGSDSASRPVGIRYDVVLIARPAVLEVPYAELQAEASLAALRLSQLPQ